MSDETPPPPSSAWRDGLAVVLHGAVVIALLAPSIFGGRVVSSADLLRRQSPWRESWDQTTEVMGQHSDSVYYFEPWFEFSRRHIEHGVPLRNPESSLGVPFVGNAQSALLCPFSWPWLVWDAPQASWIASGAKLWLAAIGCYLLARTLGLRRLPAWIAGTAFGCSGFVVLWLSYPLSSALVPLPWALLGVWLLNRRPRLAATAITGSIALAAVSGHPECAFHTGIVTLLAALGRALTLSRSGVSVRGFLTRFLVAGAAGGALAAPQILPFLDYVLQSGALGARSDAELRASRMAHPPGLDHATDVVAVLAALAAGVGLLWWLTRLHQRARLGVLLGAAAGLALAAAHTAAARCGMWNAFPLLAEPHLYGMHDHAAGDAQYCGPVNFIELNGGYLGLAFLTLAWLAPALHRRWWTWWAACGACLLISFDVPPFSQAIALVKPFDVIVNRRLLGEAALFGALLAGASLQALTTRALPRPALAGWVVALAVAAGGSWWAFDSAEMPDRTGAKQWFEHFTAPYGSPCAALDQPRARSMARGDALPLRGYLVSLQEYDHARVRLTHSATGVTREIEVPVGRPEPSPQHEMISQFPNAGRAGFEGSLDLQGFPGGDCQIAVFAPRDADLQVPLTQFRVRVVQPRGVSRLPWTAAATLAACALLLLSRHPRRGVWAGSGLALCGLVDLGHFARTHIPQIDPAVRFPAFAELDALRTKDPWSRVLGVTRPPQPILAPNTHLAYGLASVDGIDVMTHPAFKDLTNAVRGVRRERTPLENRLAFDLDHPLWPLLGVERMLVPNATAVQDDEARELFRGPGLKVLEPLRAPLRAHAYTRWIPRSDSHLDEAREEDSEATGPPSLAELLETAHTTVEETIVVPEDAVPSFLDGELTTTPPSATMIYDRPNEVRVRVEGGAACWLLVTDLHSDHFTATVDGTTVDVVPAFDHLLAVALPPSDRDTRDVVFRYEPWTWTLGLWLAALGAVAWLVLVVRTPASSVTRVAT